VIWVGIDALLPTQNTIAYPEMANLKVGGQVKKNRRYRAETFLARPHQNSGQRPWDKLTISIVVLVA